MDSHTKRLLSTRGFYSTNPLLPPVQNMRMVYLKEPFGEAEKYLHEARLALKSVNDGGDIKSLYQAMANLETKERSYFARRFGANNAVLKGWKKGLVRLNISYLVHEIQEHAEDVGKIKSDGLTTTQGYLSQALSCANESTRIHAKVLFMVDRWDNPAQDLGLLFDSDEQNIRASLTNMYSMKDYVENTSAGADTGEKTLRHMESSLEKAEDCVHMAKMIRLSQWDNLLF